MVGTGCVCLCLLVCAVGPIDFEIGRVTIEEHGNPFSPYTHAHKLCNEYRSPLDAVKSMATVKLICVLEGE